MSSNVPDFYMTKFNEMWGNGTINVCWRQLLLPLLQQLLLRLLQSNFMDRGAKARGQKSVWALKYPFEFVNIWKEIKPKISNVRLNYCLSSGVSEIDSERPYTLYNYLKFYLYTFTLHKRIYRLVAGSLMILTGDLNVFDGFEQSKTIRYLKGK